MFTLTFKFTRSTRNYAVYTDVTNEINKLYLPKGMPDTIVLVDTGGRGLSEVAHLLNPEPQAPKAQP